MSKPTIGRMLVASPFLALGSALLVGGVWLVVELLAPGPGPKGGNTALVVMTIMLFVFGGGLMQFGMNALREGHSEESGSLIRPFTLVVLGLFLTIPGLIGTFNGSFAGLIVLFAGIAVLIVPVIANRRIDAEGAGLRKSVKQEDQAS